MQSLNEPTSLVLPAALIAAFVGPSGTMFFSPAMRLASSACGATLREPRLPLAGSPIGDRSNTPLRQRSAEYTNTSSAQTGTALLPTWNGLNRHAAAAASTARA